MKPPRVVIQSEASYLGNQNSHRFISIAAASCCKKWRIVKGECKARISEVLTGFVCNWAHVRQSECNSPYKMSFCTFYWPKENTETVSCWLCSNHPNSAGAIILLICSSMLAGLLVVCMIFDGSESSWGQQLPKNSHFTNVCLWRLYLKSLMDSNCNESPFCQRHWLPNENEKCAEVGCKKYWY